MTGDLIPFIHTNVPPVLQYPVNQVSERFSIALAGLSYDESWVGRLKALFKLLGNLKK